VVDQVVAVGSDSDGGTVGSCVACLDAGVILLEAFDGISRRRGPLGGFIGVATRTSRADTSLFNDCCVVVQCEAN
jgi:hypothetical protein